MLNNLHIIKTKGVSIVKININSLTLLKFSTEIFNEYKLKGL